jgi:hypothetical protein
MNLAAVNSAFPSRRPLSGALFWTAVGLLLVWMGYVQVTSVRLENQTWDEGFHLAAGYAYLRTGDYRMRTENPPLGKLLNSLPLLLLNPDPHTDDPVWQVPDRMRFGRVFLYHNRLLADAILFPARVVTIFLSLVLALAVALWARRQFGAGVALLACFLCCLDPNLIAHGRYVTSDVIATLFIFLACAAWTEFLNSRRKRALVAAGIVLGLALASKFTALTLLPVFALLYLIRWWQRAEGLSARHLVTSLLLAGMIGALVIGVVYAPDTVRLFTHPPPPVERFADRGGLSGQLLSIIPFVKHLPAHPYLLDLLDFAEHVRTGHEAYLLGQLRRHGWWHYFLVAFAVKTPLAVLLLTAGAAVAGVGFLFRKRLLERLRAAPPQWTMVIVPPLVLFGVAMSGGHNLGLRHILPVYPFLFIAVSAAVLGLASGRRRALVAGLLVVVVSLEILESVKIHPHYLAFFNLAAGGPEAGPRYLVDSNIDWGQDLKKLKAYMLAHELPYVCLCYFGNASVRYYKVRERNIPGAQDLEGRANLDCVVAISATPLQGVYVAANMYRWLRELQPTARIGYSIYVYDLRKRR